MALASDNANGADECKYPQWEWQESDTVWRRYPCTISHKLNTIIAGQTIYVTIYEWVYVITKQNKSNGTQTNLFTQHARKIRLVGDLNANGTDEKQSEAAKQLSLYYNYSYANIVLISNLESNELKVKDLFFKSVSSTEYEITLMTQVQLSQNNQQFQTYRKQLKQNCQKHNRRKHEIEALIWSNCSNKQKNKLYAHAKQVSQIVNNENNNKQLVYFCRAIYVGKRPNYINARDVISSIPLYLINFRKISMENAFDLLHENDAEFVVDEEDEEGITKSLFVVPSASPTSYSYSYSQPLLPFMISSPKNSNGYGSIQTKNKQTTQNKHKRHKTWHEIMRQHDIEVFSSTFDLNVIIGKLLQVRESAPGTLVNLCVPVIENICVFAKTLLMQQPVLLELECPISIVGDIHGQYYDLLRLFSYGRYPPETNYLFLGDYVDRGGQSIECICLLLCYKIKYEENFFLLRGNHECENINRIYGFYDECKRRFSVRIWKKFVDVFNHLPVAAIVSQKIFCVHGGLSPELFLTPLSFDSNIRNVVRPTDIGDYGLVCDLLWSDPSFDIVGFYDNGDRGVSYYFGKDIVDCFNKTFDLDLICRAHQVVEDGYEFFNQRQLVTIFSAPNYCGEFDNCASFMQVDHDLKCSFITMDPQRKYQPMKIKKKY